MLKLISEINQLEIYLTVNLHTATSTDRNYHHHHIIFTEPKLIQRSKHNTRKQEKRNNVKHKDITLKDKK